MADVTIATLTTELATVGANDLIGVWDVAAGQYKKAKRSNVVGASIVGGGTIQLGGYTIQAPASGVVALKGVNNAFGAAQTIPSVTTADIVLNDNSVYSFAPPKPQGMILLYNRYRTSGHLANALLAFSVADSIYAQIVTQPSNAIESATVALSGTTGTAGKITVAAVNNGNIYIENRSGGAWYLGYLLIA